MTCIITPEERLAEPRGFHALIVGPYGVGKTTLLRGLLSSTALFVDIENGALAIDDVAVPHIRPQTWPEIRDLIVRIAGANPSFSSNEAYSPAHLNSVGGLLPGIDRYQTIFFDTVTSAARLCFRWASQQPETFSERSGKPDLRSTYGLHAREFLLMLHHLQSARKLNIILIGALETTIDDYGRTEHRLQAEGQRIAREISGIVDIVATMNWIDFGDGKPLRAFVCTFAEPMGLPGQRSFGKARPDRTARSRKANCKNPATAGEPWRGFGDVNHRHPNKFNKCNRRRSVMSYLD